MKKKIFNKYQKKKNFKSINKHIPTVFYPSFQAFLYCCIPYPIVSYPYWCFLEGESE